MESVGKKAKQGQKKKIDFNAALCQKNNMANLFSSAVHLSLRLMMLILVGLNGGLSFAGDALSGVGIAMAREAENVIVKAVMTNSPAGLSQVIKPGDAIIAVGQGEAPLVRIEGMGLSEVVNMIRGPRGTVVRLTIIPGGTNSGEAHVVSLIRGELPSQLLGSGPLLSNGTVAPNVNFFQFPDMRPVALTAYRGRVVVLEFWATWCAPCQESMAEIQTWAAKRPEWEAKVVFLAANIDEDPHRAEKWLKKNEWNRTHNVWSDKKSTRAFRVASLPWVFVLDERGKIVASGHRFDPRIVEGLLQ